MTDTTAHMDPRRHLALEGTLNVRDLGGYPAADGRTTQWRRFLRADGLHQLADSARDELVGLGLRTVVDLRRDRELAERPSVFAALEGVDYLQVDYVGESPIDPSQPLLEGPERIGDIYCQWLEVRRNQVRDTLRALAAPGAVPALFNCAAGKDRTGVTAALLLGLAGVPDDVIAEDYSLSGWFLVHRLEECDPRTREEYQEQASPRRAMEIVLEHLNGKYGGSEPFVRTIGLTAEEVARLRAGLLD